MSKKLNNYLYFAYWDDLGFEVIKEIGTYERRRLLDDIAGIESSTHPINLRNCLLRARLNSHRNPEIWTFSSEVGIDQILEFAAKEPHQLANLIRKFGNNLYNNN